MGASRVPCRRAGWKMKTIPWRIFWIIALAAVSIFVLIPRNVTQRVYDPAAGRMRDTVVRRVPIKLGLDLRGGVHMALEVDQSKQAVVDCADAIRRAERVIRTRVDEFGTSEPVVQVVGDCRLIVELPGITDVERAKAIVQRTAFLEFRMTDSRNELRRALPAMDAALRRAGESSATTPARDVVAGLFGAGTAAAGGSQNPDIADAPLSSLLTAGQIPGEMIVAEANVARVEALLARPELQRLVPRNLELRWGSQTTTIGPDSYRALYAVSSRPIITGEELREATAGRDPMTNAAEVRFELTPLGGRRFGELTS